LHVGKYEVFICKHGWVDQVGDLDHVSTCLIIDQIQGVLALSNQYEKLFGLNDTHIGVSYSREHCVAEVLASFRVKDDHWTGFELDDLLSF